MPHLCPHYVFTFPSTFSYISIVLLKILIWFAVSALSKTRSGYTCAQGVVFLNFPICFVSFSHSVFLFPIVR
uniref:Uncharacterized protein n=1 Tax=Daphnia magna TaxID=35525 RepID=A0A0P6H6I2_9CRUS